MDLGGVSYVLFNLSGGASGEQYMAWHSVLTTINPGSTPAKPPLGRDLFLELATAFQAKGIKVIACKYLLNLGKT
jgi:hypothetical protein